ncbi:UNVERIFIED_CONTAM: Carbon catabolite repressor protein 45, partial [Sesamum angustifolium]
MERSGDNRTVPTEHSSPPPPNSSGRRLHRQERQRSRKKRKVMSSETETRIQIQTLKPDSALMFSSYTHRRTNSYVRKQGRSRMKPRKPQRQRKWTYSTHDVSNYNGKLKLFFEQLFIVNALFLKFKEVDHFDDLKKILGSDGFRGLHKARSGETRDGCAIFWKTEQFTLLHEESIEFQRFGLRNNVAQFCVLKMNQDLPSTGATARSLCPSTSRNFLVGNIHVLYNPKRGDIKLGQMRIFLEKAYELSQEWGCIPVVITGDLNSLPQSAMYQFLASSKLHIQQHDRRHVSGQIFPSEYAESQSRHNRITRPLMSRWTDEEIMLATGSRHSVLRHHLKLCSAYAGVPKGFHSSVLLREPQKSEIKFGEPLATSYHCLFTGTVDYIWHTSDLVPVRVLETLPIRSLKKTGGLPCK